MAQSSLKERYGAKYFQAADEHQHQRDPAVQDPGCGMNETINIGDLNWTASNTRRDCVWRESPIRMVPAPVG